MKGQWLKLKNDIYLNKEKLLERLYQVLLDVFDNPTTTIVTTEFECYSKNALSGGSR